MTKPNEEKVVSDLDNLAKERLRLERELQAIDQQFEAEEAVRRTNHQARKAATQAEINVIDSRIWSLIEPNRSWLISKGKKFLTLPGGKFQFRASSGEIQVTDPRALMETARRKNLIKEVGKPPTGKWKFSLTKFREWWAKNPGKREIFASYVEEVPGGETLLLQPNSPHVVVPFDNKRKSPPSITIQKKS